MVVSISLGDLSNKEFTVVKETLEPVLGTESISGKFRRSRKHEV